MADTPKKAPQTIAASNGIATDTGHGAVTPPLYLSSTFAFQGYAKPGRFDYGRTANPTRSLLADTLAKLEGGAGAVITASGMAAIDLILAQLGPGAGVVACHDCYAGTRRLLEARSAKRQLAATFVDFADAVAVTAALATDPALILIETPSNPLMRILDIAAIAVKKKNAKLVVDNTFLSPALQQPISLGADFVIHSTTKYLNGHSDVVGGAVIAANTSDADALAAWANIAGVTGAPFDSYMTLRGLRTLFPRVETQQKTAQALAEFLTGHKNVGAVHYPGLATHPGHAIASKQQSGFGAMLSFELKGDIARCVEGLGVFTLAESLGGIESLLAHPATMTHASMSAQQREEAGISDQLLRLSIGLEAAPDLIADLERAFARA